jgi:hypothetical protein
VIPCSKRHAPGGFDLASPPSGRSQAQDRRGYQDPSYRRSADRSSEHFFSLRNQSIDERRISNAMVALFLLVYLWLKSIILYTPRYFYNFRSPTPKFRPPCRIFQSLEIRELKSGRPELRSEKHDDARSQILPTGYPNERNDFAMYQIANVDSPKKKWMGTWQCAWPGRCK